MIGWLVCWQIGRLVGWLVDESDVIDFVFHDMFHDVEVF